MDDAYCFFGGGFEEELPLPEAGGVVLLPELDEPEPVSELAGGVVVPEAGALVLEAGGVAAGAAVWLAGCLAQAAKSTAAASALRATFVFIDSTPVDESFRGKEQLLNEL